MNIEPEERRTTADAGSEPIATRTPLRSSDSRIDHYCVDNANDPHQMHNVYDEDTAT